MTFQGLFTTFEASTTLSYNTALLLFNTYTDREVTSKMVSSNDKAIRHTHNNLVQATIMNLPVGSCKEQ